MYWCLDLSKNLQNNLKKNLRIFWITHLLLRDLLLDELDADDGLRGGAFVAAAAPADVGDRVGAGP